MILSKTTIKHALTTSVVAAQHLDLFGSCPSSNSKRRWSYFLNPYQRYFNAISKYPDIDVNYQGIGSGGGIRQLIAGSDFAGSDTP